MNTVFETNFTVMPTDANYMYPLIFGGAFFAQMDLCAARTANRFLYESNTCDGAVTHKVENLTFTKPCYVGDLIHLTGTVVQVGVKSVVVNVVAEREGVVPRDLRHPLCNSFYTEKVAEGKFIFISIKKMDLSDHPQFLQYVEHDLELGD